MEIVLDASSFDYRTDYQDDKNLRAGFNALAQRVFGLDFEAWYRAGHWTERYRPCSLIYEGKVVANVSVSPMDLRCMGRELHCVRLGTVMTDPDFRRRGLCRFLISQAVEDWIERCDGIYLYANQDTRAIFEKMRFSHLREWRHSLSFCPDGEKHGMRQMFAGLTDDRLILLQKYAQSNPFSLLNVEHNPGLLLFHCGFGSLRHDLYYIEQYDVAAIARTEDDTLYCYDIFGSTQASLREVLSVLATLADTEIHKAVLGFTPKEGASCSARPLPEKDGILMSLDGRDLFGGRQLRFPLLSTT